MLKKGMKNTIKYKENLIKPHSRIKWFRMPAGKARKLQQNDIPQPGIVPGKLADESQLGGLSSLLQLSKDPIIEIKPPLPKPLKKRYRDEVYDNIEPIVEFPPPPPHVVPEPNIEENGENSKAVIETSEEEEQERLKVWREHILEENVNTKRTRARACKGQRYREFMWTSYANRRRSNRWELNQDKDEILPAKKVKTANKEKAHNKPTKTTKTANGTVIAEKSNDLINESHSDHSDNKFDEGLHMHHQEPCIGKKRKNKITKPKANSTVSINGNTTKDSNDNLMTTSGENSVDFNQNSENELEMKNNYSGFVLLAPDNNPLTNHNNRGTIANKKNVLLQEENTKLDSGLVGSKKRKARRQGIRRLAPGSTFKGVDVIAENDLSKDN